MQSVIDFFVGVADGVPTIVSAAIILAGGLFGAFLSRLLVSWLLRLVKFEALSEKTGFTEFLRKGHVSYPPSSLVGTLVYWLVLMAMLFQISRILDIRIVNAVFEQAMELVPRLLAAILVSVIGAILVSFAANFARTLAGNAGLPNARLVSRLIKYSGNIVVVVIALDQIGFGRSVINSMFIILFGALTFGLALAFGLGCKDLARDAMIRFLRNLREREDRGTDLEG